MITSTEIATTDKTEWEIQDIIEWLLEQKSNGATHLTIRGDYDGEVKLEAELQREETEEERIERESYVIPKIRFRYQRKVYS